MLCGDEMNMSHCDPESLLALGLHKILFSMRACRSLVFQIIHMCHRNHFSQAPAAAPSPCNLLPAPAASSQHLLLPMAGASGPEPDPVWGVFGDRLDSLSYMSVLAPEGGPAGAPGDCFAEPEDYIQSLRAYAMTRVDAEWLEDRRNIWAAEPDQVGRKPWMYLTAPTEKAHMSFIGWKDLITQDLKCDAQSCGAFVTLFNTQPDGFMEASKVLAHTLKDKKKKNQQDLHPYRSPTFDPDNWSNFMKNSCEEAMEALEDPPNFKNLKNKFDTQGLKGFGGKPVGPPGPDGYHGKGCGKGPGGYDGKGMCFQKGMR